MVSPLSSPLTNKKKTPSSNMIIIGFVLLGFLILLGFTVGTLVLYNKEKPSDPADLEYKVNTLQGQVNDLTDQVNRYDIPTLQDAVTNNTTRLNAFHRVNSDQSNSFMNIKDINFVGDGTIDTGSGNQVRIKVADNRYISVDSRDMLQIGYFTQGDDDKKYWYFNNDGDFGGPIGHGISQDDHGTMTLDNLGYLNFINGSVMDGTNNDYTVMHFQEGRNFSLTKTDSDIFKIGTAKNTDGKTAYWYYNQNNQTGPSQWQ